MLNNSPAGPYWPPDTLEPLRVTRIVHRLQAAHSVERIAISLTGQLLILSHLSGRCWEEPIR